MSAPRRGAPVWRVERVDSTNLFLRRMAGEAAEGAVVIAREQSAGRGRSGRSFLSPEGGLYLSMLLRPAVAPERLMTLTPVAAVAVCRAVERCSPLRCGIKWPNDVVAGGKKLCGILVESVLGGARPCVIVGIGVNANTEDFPEELGAIAGSIRQLTGERVDLEALSDALIGELDAAYAAWLRDAAAAREEFSARCLTVGREVCVEGRAGRAVGLGDDYALLVTFADGGREALRFGEVSVRGLYGYL